MTTLAAAALAQPTVQWVNPMLDFGAIAEADGVAQREFLFVNTGDEPVSVVGVRTSCGCTTARVPLDPVEPGDTAAIVVKYDPTSRPGKFEKKVTVSFSDDLPSASLRVTGVVIGTPKTLHTRYPIDAGDMRLHASIIPFGDVRKSGARSDFMEIYNASRDTITPVWSGLPDYVTVAPAVNNIPPGQQAVYNLMFSGYRCPLYGLVNDSIYVATNADAPPVKVDVVAVVTEDFSRLTPAELNAAPVIAIDNDRLDFGTFHRDDAPRSLSFNITNRGKNPLILRRVYTPDKGIAISADKDKIKKGKSAKITVTFDPATLDADILNARIEVISNDPHKPNVTVRAIGLSNP